MNIDTTRFCDTEFAPLLEMFAAGNGQFPVYSDSYMICPGLCDVHVHLREPGFSYKETIRTGSMAGAHGGYTALCAMPNLDPVPDSAQSLEAESAIIRRDAVIRVLPYGAITVGEKGEKLSEMERMSPHVCAFSDDGKGVQNGEQMRKAMLEAKKCGKIIVAHCEDESLLRGGYIHDGAYARAHGHRGICSESEYRQIERDLTLAAETGASYHVCHISAKESVELIRRAKRAGIDVTCETAPHYLLLSENDLEEDGRYKMNPPLRAREDVDAVIEGLRDGTIDAIATDHAPHSEEEKLRTMQSAPFGIVGLETAVPLTISELVRPGVLTPLQMAAKMSANPAKVLGIDKGNLAEGKIADVTIIDPEVEYIIDKNKFRSQGKNTPFHGRKVFGEVEMTICGGEIVYAADRMKQ